MRMLEAVSCKLAIVLATMAIHLGELFVLNLPIQIKKHEEKIMSSQ